MRFDFKNFKFIKQRVGAGLMACVLLLVLSGCGGANRNGANNNADDDLSDAPDTGGVAVRVASVDAENISTDNKVSGTLAAEDEATIMVAVSARCTNVYVKAGETVRRGQILCKLDLGSTLSQYSAARISYDSALQSYNDQVALLDLQVAMAKEDVASVDGQISVTKDQIKIAESQVSVLEQQISMAEKQIPVAQKQVDMAEKQIPIAQKQAEMAEKQIPMTEQQIAYLESQLDVLNTQIKQSEKAVSDTEALLAIGAASQSDLDNVKLALDNLKVNKLSLEYNLEQVRLSLDNAQITLDNASLALDSAQIALDNAKTNLDNSKINRDNAKLGLEQQKAAIESSKFQLTQQELSREKAQIALRQQESNRNATVAQLDVGIESARSNVQQLSNVLEDVDENGNVIAPISGVLTAFNASENNYIPTTMALAVIDGEDEMKITVSVSEALVPKLNVGDMTEVYISSVNRDFEAEIRSIERAANQQRLYTITLSVPRDVTEGLMAGMSADVTFHMDRVDHAIVVPSEAILTNGATQYVFIVEGGLARYVEVTTGLTGTGVTEILSGLNGGEWLITVGQSYVRDGDPVRVVGGNV